MKGETFSRLHTLRMENDAAKYEMEEMRPRFDRMAGRHENGTAPRAVTAFQLFQTPPEIAARLVSLLNLQPGARVLEPSAGLGRLLDALQPLSPADVVAVEIAQQCAGELFKQNRAGVTIKQRDFLDCDPYELGLFDAVVMNPPFHMRADIRHIQHALQFLKRGGKLAAICFNTSSRQDVFREIAETWEEIPVNAFSKSGTGVSTVMFSISTT